MTRKKIEESEKLIHKITIRVSTPFKEKMEGWLAHSNSSTLAELARMIVCKEEIIWYHKDEATEMMAIEMAAIRKELNAIGHNINQVTRYFNSTAIPSQKIFEALRLLDEYSKVTKVIERITETLNKLNHGSQSH